MQFNKTKLRERIDPDAAQYFMNKESQGQIYLVFSFTSAGVVKDIKGNLAQSKQ